MLFKRKGIKELKAFEDRMRTGHEEEFGFSIAYAELTHVFLDYTDLKKDWFSGTPEEYVAKRARYRKNFSSYGIMLYDRLVENLEQITDPKWEKKRGP